MKTVFSSWLLLQLLILLLVSASWLVSAVDTAFEAQSEAAATASDTTTTTTTTTTASASSASSSSLLDAKDAAFLASLKKEGSGYVELEEGVFLKITEPGPDETARRPTLNDDIQTHFVGKFPNGTVFDSSHERGSMMQVPVAHTLRGWQIALPHMKQGDAAQVCLAPEWAFGATGAPPHVAPQQAVCYTIHLEQVLDGDQHHYIHPDYEEYAEQYRELLERQGGRRRRRRNGGGGASASVTSEL